MRVYVIILSGWMIFVGTALGQQKHIDSAAVVPAQPIAEQVKEVEMQVDQNAKIVSLLTLAIGGLVAAIGVLFAYIIKLHGKTETLAKVNMEVHVKNADALMKVATDNTTALIKFDGTIDKLATSIETSSESLKDAVVRSSQISDDVHKFLLKNIRPYDR